MSIEKKDITIIIQGPLDSTSLDKIEHYVDFGKIIVSHWSTDPIELQRQLVDLQVKYDNISSISSSDAPVPFLMPSRLASVQVKDYRFHQFQSLHEALKLCKTKYSVKTRSDEYWINIDYMLQKFSKDKNKLVTSNVFYKPYYEQNYHISDHLMIAKTETLLLAMEIISQEPKEEVMRIVSESTFGWAFLQALSAGIPDNYEAFEKYFDFVNINNFDGYLVRWNSPPRGPKLVWSKPDGHLYLGENGVV